jgi:predicted phosphoribosyltransferase
MITSIARFADRRSAGRLLTQRLANYRRRDDLIILGLPRGGVPVAYEVARAMDAPLDVFVVRKLGVPGNPELAMGAIASGGVTVANEDVIRELQIPNDTIDAAAAQERAELDRRERLYRGNAAPLDLHDRTVILVDDGLATGATMRAATIAAAKLGATWVTIAVPVAPAETCRELAHFADDLVCLMMPEQFRSVGEWYDDFTQVEDDEVRALLAASHKAFLSTGKK